MHRYVALRACIYNGEHYKVGQYLQEDAAPMACPACTGGTPEGICHLCKGSKRVSPPHHFKLLGGESNAEEKEIAEIPESHKEVRHGEAKEALLEEAKTSERDALRAEIKRLGGSYHPFAGAERLKMELQKLQKEVGERNVAPVSLE